MTQTRKGKRKGALKGNRNGTRRGGAGGGGREYSHSHNNHALAVKLGNLIKLSDQYTHPGEDFEFLSKPPTEDRINQFLKDKKKTITGDLKANLLKEMIKEYKKRQTKVSAAQAKQKSARAAASAAANRREKQNANETVPGVKSRSNQSQHNRVLMGLSPYARSGS